MSKTQAKLRQRGSYAHRSHHRDARRRAIFKAQAIYAAAGVTLDDMVRNMILKTVEDESVPMDFFRPNAETVAAMQEARGGNLEITGSIADLMVDPDSCKRPATAEAASVQRG